MYSRTKVCEFCQQGYHEHCPESEIFRYIGFCKCEMKSCQKVQWDWAVFHNSIIFKRILRHRNSIEKVQIQKAATELVKKVKI